MNDDTGGGIFWLWASLATLSGAISSISLRPYKEMSKAQIAMAFTVSSTFAMFVGSFVAEWVARRFFGPGPINLRAFGAVMWFMAAASHFLLPVMISRAKRFADAFGEVEQKP